MNSSICSVYVRAKEIRPSMPKTEPNTAEENRKKVYLSLRLETSAMLLLESPIVVCKDWTVKMLNNDY